MKRIAIIPARGGSKRLPRKNIIEIDGKPMLVHSVQTAFESQVFDRIIVSTEDREIASIAESIGAEVLNRPRDLASDAATVKDVCIHVLDTISSECKVKYFCVLTATSILRDAQDIRSSFEMLKTGYDFVSSVCEYFFYPHAAIYVDKRNKVNFQWPKFAFKKGQEVPNYIVENGSINWCRTDAFLKEKCFIGKNTGLYRMPKFKSIDIDTEDDLIALKAMYSYLKNNTLP